MTGKKGQKAYFTERLMHWHAETNQRSLPWKEEKDPYKVWLSEIILQQTRAQQGLPYYLRFTEAFPDVHALASAKDEEAFRLWQGLGYYNRCKNMLVTARHISDELNGKFPDTYEDILALKGIGPYTASAIASFAYDLPQAVVDGNVYRVLARYYGIDTPIDSTEGKKLFQQLAQELLDIESSAAYNQAIMDLGATICTPALPKCMSCPLQKHCVAYKQQLTTLLPVKSKKVEVRKRYFHYLLIHANESLWITKRQENDIWQNLHEPLLIEADKALDAASIAAHDTYRELALSIAKPVYEGSLKQKLTHQLIETRFFSIHLKEPVTIDNIPGKWTPVNTLKNLAFPKTLVSFLEKKLYF